MHDLFTAALFRIAKTWKQPKCPSTEEWIQKMWYIYTMEYYSAIKKNEIPAFFTTWMDLETIMLSEVIFSISSWFSPKWSQPYNETPTSNAFTDMWNLKKGQTELLCRTDADSQTLKNLWSPEETVWVVGDVLEGVGCKSYKTGYDDHCTTISVINSLSNKKKK